MVQADRHIQEAENAVNDLDKELSLEVKSVLKPIILALKELENAIYELEK